MQLLDFFHHRGINRQTSGGVHDQHIVVMLARKIQRRQRNVARLLADVRGEKINVQLLCQSAQLFDGSRAVHVATDQQHFFLQLLAQQFGQLAAGGGLARTLQTGHQDHGGRHGGEIERVVVLAHQPGQLAMHDTDQCLPRRQAANHLLTQRGLFHLGGEFLHHRQRYVGFQQGQTHFAQGVLDVAFGQARLPAQVFYDAGKAAGKVV